jgi:hypothetical protein
LLIGKGMQGREGGKYGSEEARRLGSLEAWKAFSRAED